MTSAILPVITLVIGAVFGLWLGKFVDRPKLRLSGSGSGGGVYHATIENSHALIGVRVGETILFGRLLWHQKEIGLPVDRRVARRCGATLIDRKTGRTVTSLFFRPLTDPNWEFGRPQVDIGPGEQFILMLMQEVEGGEHKYVPFRPGGWGDQAPTFEGSHEFEVKIHSNGRKLLKLRTEMIVNFDGRMSYRVGRGHRGGGGSFGN